MYKSSNLIKKLEKPVLTYKDIPYRAALIFNAGVAKINGKYIMLFRNDYGVYDKPLIAPELPFETDEGFRTDVIFPGGMILEENGEVKIYYGASDTVECLATANAEELAMLCLGNK